MTLEQSIPFRATTHFRCKVRHIPKKRIFDLLFSLAVLILGSPLFFLIAVAIRLSSKGQVIYSHERVGRGGKCFQCYKFRTMYPDADQRLEKLLLENPRLEEEWKKRRKLKNDPRVTPIGVFLRKSSLDELPQFWNVIKGDLSVVGPRPVVIDEIRDYYGAKAKKILAIRPGITGIWQVSGRSDQNYENRITLDEQYVDSQSFMLDLKLILKTIPGIFSFKGAY